MTHSLVRAGVAASLALLAAGCSTQFPYLAVIETEKRSLAEDSAIFTRADLRGVVNVKVDAQNFRNGRIHPRRVYCAEPSPDVAKAVADAFTAAAEVEAKGAKGSGQLSKSSAESIAQLGERLATIQLLRDGYYRACESYANGATSDVTYAMIMSGLSDTMETLLASELAAGAFGRSLAGASTQATGKAANQIPSDPVTQERLKQIDADLANAKEAEKKAEIATAGKPPADPAHAELAGKKAKTQELEKQRDALRVKEASTSAGGTFGALGPSLARGAAHAPKSVEAIHRASLNKQNTNSLLFACIVVLDRQDSTLVQSPRGKNSVPRDFKEFCAWSLPGLVQDAANRRNKIDLQRQALRKDYLQACNKLSGEALSACLNNMTML